MDASKCFDDQEGTFKEKGGCKGMEDKDGHDEEYLLIDSLFEEVKQGYSMIFYYL